MLLTPKGRKECTNNIYTCTNKIPGNTCVNTTTTTFTNTATTTTTTSTTINLLLLLPSTTLKSPLHLRRRQ